MSTAHINFEDVGNGTFNVQAVFSPHGFDPESHAHQHAQIVLKFLDTHLTRVGSPHTDFVESVAESKTLDS